MEDKLQVFEDKKIRSVWNEEEEEWYFSVVDVVGVLTEQATMRNASTYWAVLKKRLNAEGASELLTNCKQLKLTAADGKQRLTDVATVKQLFRIIQSVPSPRAEPVKRWLAQVGAERVQETIDPEQAIERAKATYLAKGYPPEWVNQRALSIQVRQGLTDEWKKRGVADSQYALLTDIIHRSWADLSVREHKKLKGLKKENLRDNMTTMELILTMLAEESTTQISKSQEPKTLREHKGIAQAGGAIAKRARREVEKETGKPVVTSQNAKGRLLK